MVDPLSFSHFQPLLLDWYNKICGMCYPVCGIVHIKDPLLPVFGLVVGMPKPSVDIVMLIVLPPTPIRDP